MASGDRIRSKLIRRFDAFNLTQTGTVTLSASKSKLIRRFDAFNLMGDYGASMPRNASKLIRRFDAFNLNDSVVAGEPLLTVDAYKALRCL